MKYFNSGSLESDYLRRLLAEFIGTAWLVFGGCGSAVFSTNNGNLGVALAFGFTVVTGIYALGHFSGGHFNPAVTIGVWVGGRIPPDYIFPYMVSQILGAAVSAGLLYTVAMGQPDFNIHSGLASASNGYESLSPGHFSLISVFLVEVVCTSVFVLVIMGATDKMANTELAPVAIGLCLSLIHLISIPVDNTSINPARSTATAIFSGGGYLNQLWLFWVGPLIGGILGGGVYRFFFAKNTVEEML